MATDFGDSYQALIGKIEKRLASRSREGNRQLKDDNSINLGRLPNDTCDVLINSRDRRPEKNAWSKTDDQISVNSHISKPKYKVALEKEIYRTRGRILEEERIAKEEPDVGSLINCIMPVVMDQVKRYLSTFKKEMINELRKEMSRSMSEKLEEVYQGMHQLNHDILYQKNEMQDQFEKALESLVNLSYIDQRKRS